MSGVPIEMIWIVGGCFAVLLLALLSDLWGDFNKTMELKNEARRDRMPPPQPPAPPAPPPQYPQNDTPPAWPNIDLSRITRRPQ